MLNRSTFAALLALVAVAVFPAAAGAAPASSGAVVFSKLVVDGAEYETAEKEKFVKPPEGGLFAAKSGRLNQLTENPGDSQPAFSPDGRTIAFVREGDLYAMRADGSGQRSLTAGPEIDGRPSFSPDGRLILFERGGSTADTPHDLFTIRFRGGGLHALAPSPADEHEASFSPDGRLVVFVRGTAEAGGGVAEDLYSVRSSGARLVRLTRTAGPDEFAPFYCRGGIAFSRGQSGEGPSAFADIYTMGRNGRRVRPLIRGAGSAYVEDVTQGGGLLLFRRDQGLWVVSLPAKGKPAPRARKLSEVPDGSATSAVFSSNGREVAAFAETETATEARQTLTAVSVATRSQRQLAEGFSFSQGTVTTTIGPVIAWQPVRQAQR